MSVIKSIGILGAVILVIALFLVLVATIGLREPWAAFLFLFQWSMMEGTKLDRLPHSALGAAMGVAIASLPPWLAPFFGAHLSLSAMVLAIIVAVFLLIRQMAGLVINPATMAFLTVATIPHIEEATKPVDIFLGIVMGVVFFGGLAAIPLAIAKRQKWP